MHYAWTSIYDEEQVANFAMSPYFGFVYRYKSKVPKAARFLIGAKINNFRMTLPTGQPDKEYEKSGNLSVTGARKILMKLADTMPLYISLHVIVVASKFIWDKSFSADQYRTQTINYYGLHNNHNCLPLAICRFSLLKKIGLKPVLCLGNLIPTNLSHAWIEIDGVALFENPDFHSNFRKMLEFYC